MNRHVILTLATLCCFQGTLWPYATSAPPGDSLDRANPRSSVTAFLEACHSSDYTRAAQYLDLKGIAEKNRAEDGPRLAKQLEAILNSDGHFNVLQLSQSPTGNLSDDTNPALEHVAAITRGDNSYPIELERVELTPGLPVWLFSSATTSNIPSLTPVSTQSAVEARLPRFLVTVRLLDTPIWKWIVLLCIAVLVVTVFRFSGHLLAMLARNFAARFELSQRWVWVVPILQPWFIVLSAITFDLAEQFIDPSALGRLYIGRFLLLVVVAAFAWGFVILVDLFLSRLDTMLEARQRAVSHSLIYIGRRTAKGSIYLVAGIIILDNWGYNMTTMIAGLGVGGIAVALAAQGTIANIFGGVSVIADHPVMVGDFGNFGGVLGSVEDIGMRSTRVRTLNRTMMSIPNASFAGMNLENYALRDKILFNPTFQIKRGIQREKIRQLMQAIEDLLEGDKRMEIGPTPVRLSNLTAPSFAMEIFAYARTADINEFYKIEADLFLEIDALLASSGVELV